MQAGISRLWFDMDLMVFSQQVSTCQPLVVEVWSQAGILHFAFCILHFAFCILHFTFYFTLPVSAGICMRDDILRVSVS